MRYRVVRSWNTAVVATCGLVAALLVAHAQQPAGASGQRRVSQPAAAPAIDTGLAPEQGARLQRAQAAGRGDLARATLPYHPGKVIVKFRGGAASTRAAAAQSVGATDVYTPSYADFDIMRIDESADPEAVAQALMSRDDVEFAQAAYRVYPYFRPNDPLYSNQWNFPAIAMEEAWDINPGSNSSITVAVLDTGAAYMNAIFEFTGVPFTLNGVRYPALGRVQVPFAAAPELGASSRFVSPRDFIWEDSEPVDMEGHGTHVSGTIGQVTNNGVGVAGMAFNVKIMPVKCVDTLWDVAFDSPSEGSDDTVARAIRYAADNGAKVVNISLGRSAGGPAVLIGDAIRYATERGVFVAVAGGNGYEDGNPVERYAEQAAPIEGAMVVGAVGRSLNRAYYSAVKSYIEIAAPGGDVRTGGSSGSGLILQQTYSPLATDTYLLGPSRYTAPRFDVLSYEYYQGTSMATPHVAGMAALLMSQGITNPAAVEAAIKRFATDRGAAGRDDEYGAGLINPRAALRGLGIVK
jgi:serine protease